MKRSIALVLGLFVMGNAHRAFAQDAAPGPGTVEATVMPGGAMFFTSRSGASGFGDYTLGGAVTYNISRVIGLEGQVSGSIGISNRSLRLAGRVNCPVLAVGASACILSGRAPNMLDYSGAVVVSMPTHRWFIPYATRGAGGPTDFGPPPAGTNLTPTILVGQ